MQIWNQAKIETKIFSCPLSFFVFKGQLVYIGLKNCNNIFGQVSLFFFESFKPRSYFFKLSQTILSS